MQIDPAPPDLTPVEISARIPMMPKPLRRSGVITKSTRSTGSTSTWNPTPLSAMIMKICVSSARSRMVTSLARACFWTLVIASRISRYRLEVQSSGRSLAQSRLSSSSRMPCARAWGTR